MLRQLFVFVFALFALNATADTNPRFDTLDEYITTEIEKSELEQELFGTPTNGEDIVSIASIEVYEIEEEIALDFDTADYLPQDFDAKAGMEDFNCDDIELYELEEEIDLGFDTKDYLPKNFNPYRGMDCDKGHAVTFNF